MWKNHWSSKHQNHGDQDITHSQLSQCQKQLAASHPIQWVCPKGSSVLTWSTLTFPTLTTNIRSSSILFLLLPIPWLNKAHTHVPSTSAFRPSGQRHLVAAQLMGRSNNSLKAFGSNSQLASLGKENKSTSYFLLLFYGTQGWSYITQNKKIATTFPSTQKWQDIDLLVWKVLTLSFKRVWVTRRIYWWWKAVPKFNPFTTAGPSLESFI